MELLERLVDMEDKRITLYRFLQGLNGVRPKVASRTILGAKPDNEGVYNLFGELLSEKEYDAIYWTYFSSFRGENIYYLRPEGAEFILRMYIKGRLPMNKNTTITGIDEMQKLIASMVRYEEHVSRYYYLTEHFEDITEADIKEYGRCLIDEVSGEEFSEIRDYKYHKVKRITSRDIIIEVDSWTADNRSNNPKKCSTDRKTYRYKKLEEDRFIVF